MSVRRLCFTSCPAVILPRRLTRSFYAVAMRRSNVCYGHTQVIQRGVVTRHRETKYNYVLTESEFIYLFIEIK